MTDLCGDCQQRPHARWCESESYRQAKELAWREGWLAGNRSTLSDEDADSIDSNPHLEDYS